jgi:ribbon-helix-helix CopG family protein
MTDQKDIQVHEGRRAGVVVSVRLKADEADLLEALSERDGRSLSETLRVALHAFATSPGAGRDIGLQGELSPVTSGEWAEADFAIA